MDDVRGDLFGIPHGTTPAAVLANKNIKVNSFESNENTQRQRGPYRAISDNESSSVTLNKEAMNARRFYCNFIDLFQGCLYQRLFNYRVGSKQILSSIWLT